MELLPDPPATSLDVASQATFLPTPPAPVVPRAGELTRNWATVFWIGWLLIAASFVAVWVSSVKLGLATWWLGPTTAPRFFLLNVLPFIAPLGLAVASLMKVRKLPLWGVAGAALTAGIAAFDISTVPGYAVIEFGLAGAGLLVSLAALGGMYRAMPSD